MLGGEGNGGDGRCYRSHPRWVRTQMALAEIGEKKYLGRTGDFSQQGVRLNLLKAVPLADQKIRVAVVFDNDLLGFDGRVVYALPTPWGSTVGVHCGELSQQVLDAVSRSEAPPPGPFPPYP